MGIHQYPGEGGFPPIAQQVTYQVFAGYHLSDVPPFVPNVTSCPFESIGDTVIVSFSVINATPGAVLNIELQGSQEGQMWQTLPSTTKTGFGYGTLVQTDVIQPQVRVSMFVSEPGGLPSELRADVNITSKQAAVGP